jgi:hypothetical protein
VIGSSDVEVSSMYVVVHHRIKDPQEAFSRGQALLEGTDAPAGVRVREFLPSRDRTAVTCLWEAGSLEVVRKYVDAILGDSSENTWFEVDRELARGLPVAA